MGNPKGVSMITSIEQYQELATMTDTAEDALTSKHFGAHYLLCLKLYTEHGIKADRLGAIREARKLCDEFMAAYIVEAE